jgi:hypothetical protein
MTDFEVEIADVVLRGVPATYRLTFGALVEDRIGVLARGGELPGHPGDGADEQALAELVARQVWGEVRRATGGLRGEDP